VPGVLLLSVIAVAGAALDPPLPPSTARITFADDEAAPSDGWYSKVGETDQMLYLVSCSSNSVGAISLRKELTTRIDYPTGRAPFRPSLYQILFQDRDTGIGFKASCPGGS
jgi:hypothetical protein